MSTESKRRDRFHLRKGPVALAVLSGLAVVSFLAVSALSRIYSAQQNSLATEWSARGAADLNTRNYKAASVEFETALRYARDNYTYQLSLAEALIGLNRTDQAYAYLINLWRQQPENGIVNLELARIAAGRGETEQALRSYNNAIYAIWPGNLESNRQNTRWELVDYLLSIHARPQAQSELIALAAELEDDSSQQARLGALFLKVQDYDHALAAFRHALNAAPHDVATLAGAGAAAFELGRFTEALRYLEQASAANPNDAEVASRLERAKLVARIDPFRREISTSERNRAVMNAFSAAGDRLKECSIASSISTAVEQSLADQWARLKPQITEYNLRQNPDLVNVAMELVFSIERESIAGCGKPNEVDSALLRVAKLREGN